ncbi:hypothetical protein P8452_63390 [Trifolium repens]|nr:hypothetical protein P8452_63390 [Trifolium repens]
MARESSLRRIPQNHSESRESSYTSKIMDKSWLAKKRSSIRNKGEQQEKHVLGKRKRSLQSLEHDGLLGSSSKTKVLAEFEPIDAPTECSNEDKTKEESKRSGSKSKKTRGPTTSLKIHGLREEERLPIRLNMLGQPVGSNRAPLSNYLGTLAKNAHLVPIKYTSWKELKINEPESWEDDMWATITSKIDIEERGKKWVFKTICSSWKTNKCRLKKKHFNANMTEVYNLKNRPSSVQLEQWRILMKYWKSSKAESELEDVMSLQPNILEQGSSRDDLLSQVLGKDRNGFVRTYGKGVVPSDLWGTKSQVEIQKTIEEVKRNAQVEIQILQERLQKEMEVKSKEQLEAFKSELLGGFNSVLAQIRQCFPGIVIPDLFSIPNINDMQGDAQSSASTHLTGVDPNKHTKSKSKEHKTKKVKAEKDPNMLDTNDVQGDPCSLASNHLTNVDPNKHTKSMPKEHKTKKVKAEKNPNMLYTNDVQGDPCSLASNHLTNVDPNKHTKSKSKEHKTKKVKIEKDPNILEHPPKSFSLLFDQDFENSGNRMAVIAWKSLSNEDKIHHLEKIAKRKAKYEKLQKDMEIQRDGRGQRNNSAAALVVV